MIQYRKEKDEYVIVEARDGQLAAPVRIPAHHVDIAREVILAFPSGTKMPFMQLAKAIVKHWGLHNIERVTAETALKRLSKDSQRFQNIVYLPVKILEKEGLIARDATGNVTV